MVDVSDGQFRLDAGNPHGLILEICHRTGGVLRQGLVNAQTDFAAGGCRAIHKMGVNDLLSNRLSHICTSLNVRITHGIFTLYLFIVPCIIIPFFHAIVK